MVNLVVIILQVQQFFVLVIIIPIFQSIISAINRFNPLRLIDKRNAIHFRQNFAQFRLLTSVWIEYNHPNTIKRWNSQNPASVSITPVYKTALTYGNKIAIKDEFGEYSYQQIYSGAAKISFEISKICGTSKLFAI